MGDSIVIRLRDSLGKSRDKLFGALTRVLSFGGDLNEDTLDEVEDILYSADLGVHAAEMLTELLRERQADVRSGVVSPLQVLQEAILDIVRCEKSNGDAAAISASPYIILVAGVNGVGKTTTIGKLATRYVRDGRSVLIAACDTFRAAAVEQLQEWANRAGCDFIGAQEGADAASVAFDTMQRAKIRKNDIVLIDTAGRLHTSKNLMEELKKIKRVIAREHPEAPHETLLVLDAGTGRNAVSQAETFHRELGVTGLVVTKLDGTAKGGVVVSVIDQLGIPVEYIGVGEGVDDLREFDADRFVDALLGDEN